MVRPMISNQETLNLSPYMAIYRNRYKIEAKNSELKNPHGYDTARSTGLFGMGIQAATTIFAVNLKRIIKLINAKE